MRIVCTSDLHGFVYRVPDPVPGSEPYRTISNRATVDGSPELPDGDVLIVAGDFTRFGKIYEVVQFNQWLATVPIRHKLVVAGNHDRVAELEKIHGYLSNATYLQDQAIEIEGVKFYGSPWTPRFFDWSFMLPRGSESLRAKWAAIPVNTDVLITHGPPAGKLDYCRHEYLGCDALRERILTVKPKLHVFGHVHGCHGVAQNADTTFVNASLCNGAYFPVNEPIVIDL